MAWFFALIPILVLMVGMIQLGWSAARAGLAAAIVGIILAITTSGYDAAALFGTVLEALFLAATILWIVFPALAVYEFQTRSGAAARMGAWLATVSGRREVLALVLAWFFAMLLEGAAGFGTPVALVAPMLVALGFSPCRSVVLALIGHAAAVSFGAVGTPIVPLLDAYAVDAALLSGKIMTMHALIGWTLAALVYHLAQPTRTGASLAAPVAAALFFVPALALAWLTGPELPALGGALIGGALFVTFARWRWPAGGDVQPVAAKLAFGAVLPYVLVLAIILATRTIPAISTKLQAVTLEWNLAGGFGGAVAPLYHPGTMLLAALACTWLAKRGDRRFLAPSMAAAGARLPAVALALISVLLLARVMVHSGMIGALADAAAGSLGPHLALAVPIIGALGSFITGSATASNILLADFQIAAAEATSMDPVAALAGQGFGAASGNMIAPHNVVAGAATVGLIGREGAILKVTLPVCIGYAALGGLLLYAVPMMS
jgi:lactate permease